MIQRILPVDEPRPALFHGRNCKCRRIVIRMTAFVSRGEQQLGVEGVHERSHLIDELSQMEISFPIRKIEADASLLGNPHHRESLAQFVTPGLGVILTVRKPLLARVLHIARAAIRDVQNMHVAIAVAV